MLSGTRSARTGASASIQVSRLSPISGSPSCLRTVLWPPSQPTSQCARQISVAPSACSSRTRTTRRASSWAAVRPTGPAPATRTWGRGSAGTGGLLDRLVQARLGGRERHQLPDEGLELLAARGAPVAVGVLPDGDLDEHVALA